MLRGFIICILFIGIGISLYSLKLPYYTDTAAKDRLDEQSRNIDTFDRSFKNQYYSEVDKLKTNKTVLIDLGTGLSIFSLCVLISTFILGISHIRI